MKRKKTKTEIEDRIYHEAKEKIEEGLFREPVEMVPIRRPKLRTIDSETSEIEDIGVLDENNRVLFSVDASAPNDVISFLIEEHLSGLREKHRIKIRRYDLEGLRKGIALLDHIERTGESLLKKTKKDLGTNKNPTDDDTVKTTYETNRRLVARAKKIKA